MCKQLINRGCDPLIVDKFKKTAATWAKLHHHVHVVDYLNMFKKEKNQKLKSNSESMQIERKGKKKELPKNEYFLVITGSDGQTRPLTQQ
jgi:ankyrin repeat protein